jgi:hypothetical protein
MLVHPLVVVIDSALHQTHVTALSWHQHSLLELFTELACQTWLGLDVLLVCIFAVNVSIKCSLLYVVICASGCLHGYCTSSGSCDRCYSGWSGCLYYCNNTRSKVVVPKCLVYFRRQFWPFVHFVTFSAMYPWYSSGRLFKWASIYSICMMIICIFLWFFQQN